LYDPVGWGGVPTCSALDGLSKEERQGKSAVVKLTFAAAFILPEGVSLRDLSGAEDPWKVVVVRPILENAPTSSMLNGCRMVQ
jgi:hypothetical protein